MIVVDNNSTDGTYEKLSELTKKINFELKIIRNNENLGFAKGNNLGVKEAKYSNLLFLNNDTIAEHDFIDKPIRLLNSSKVGAVGIKLLYPDGLIQHAGLAFGKNKLATHIFNFYKSDYPQANKTKEVSAITGACFFIKKNIFEQLGGFDEIFINGQEDIDLCMKIKKAGLKIWYVPEAWVYHLESQSANRLEKAFQNRHIFLKRWSEEIEPDIDLYYSEIDNYFANNSLKLKYQLPKKINFAIKIGVPNRGHKNWGDIYFAESLAKSLRKLGHNAVIHYLNEWNQSDESINAVIHIKGLSKYQLKPNNLNIIWVINHPELHTLEELNQYDLIFIASKKIYNQIKDDINKPIFYLPQATDREFFNFKNIVEKKYDILFVGNNYEAKNNKCRKIISDLLNAKSSYNLKIFGEHWENFVDKKYIGGDFVKWEELPKLYSEAKIVLNDHQKSMKENGFVNNRTFDVAQTKTFQISNYVEGIEEFEIENYKTADELKSKIDFYLSNDDKRERKAEENYKNSKSCTFDFRTEEILSKIYEFINSKPNSKVCNFDNPLNIDRIEIAGSAFKEFKESLFRSTSWESIEYKGDPIVAVIMTTFNRKESLADAIQSVINQTYKDWNLILVNDGGEDVSEIVNIFNDPRIKYFSKENRGKSTALNFAIRNSKSKYIAYLDDDDQYYPNHLEVLVNILETHEGIKFAYSIAEEVSMIENNYQWIEAETSIKYAKQVTTEMLRFMNHIPNLCAVHERSLFDLAGQYDESLEVLIDWDMYRRLAQFKSPKFINVVTAKYFRKKSGGINAKNQLTGMYFSDPIKYYHNRLKITSKNWPLNKNNDKPCIIIDLKDKNKSDANFFIAKYDNFKNIINCELLLVISCKIDFELLESIIYAERVGALVIFGENQNNLKSKVEKILANSLSSKNLYFDSLDRFNLQILNDVNKTDIDFVHFSENLKYSYQHSFYKNLNIGIEKKVSIVIPTYNNWNLTANCLKSIYKVKNKTNFELLIIDNGSTDETVKGLKEFSNRHKNIKVILNENNLGFAKANNIGAKAAKNNLLLFLNNDTVVTDYWLDELVNTSDNEKVGIAGAKLLYPGTNNIQHAGVVIADQPQKIFPYHIFANEEKDFRISNFIQEYQAVTGACLLIKKDLFIQVNGFDENFINGYEDVDLCFKIRELGFQVIYNPKSVVIHYESKSEGRFHNVEHNVNLLHEKWEGKISKDDINKLFNPRVSIIIPILNQIEFTRKCINSIKTNTYTNYEIIIINNASTDETKEFLEQNTDIVVINNEENLGYPKAINQGLKIAKGEDVILLNNDTIVTNGWLERLLKVKQSSDKIGLVGVFSNSISGLQFDKNCKYKSIEEMHKYAEKNYSNRNYAWIKYPRVAFVCTLITRELVNKIGGLDERFSPGNFEDDDFCLRAQLAGFKTVIASDVFIHHYGSVSFKQYGEDKYAERLKINEQRFIAKWGTNPEGVWQKGEKINKREIKYPINTDLYLQSLERSFISVEDEDYDLALENLKLALENFNNSNRKGYENITQEDLLNMAGNLALSKNELEEAKTFFEKQLEENPNSSKACFGLGEVFIKAEMFEESKTMLEWAVVNDAQNQNAIIKLKIVNQKLNFPETHNSLIIEKNMVGK